MQLRTLHINEAFNMRPVDDIAGSLAGKTLIVMSLKATGQDPELRHVQIVSITAIAIEFDTGAEVGAVNEEVALNIATMRQMDYEDSARASDDWVSGDMGVRDWLNAADYNLDDVENTQKPSEVDVALFFQSFFDNYSGSQVLIAHNIPFILQHLNHVLPTRLKVPMAIDTLEFTKLYFEPVLSAMMMQGNTQASNMADKMWDDMQRRLDPTIRNLSRAFGVHATRWHSSSLEEVRQLAGVFSKMLKFLRRNRHVFKETEFQELAASALERFRQSKLSAKPA